MLGSTSPNASVTIKGTNTTTDAPLILKTITADEKGIFKTSMFVSTDSIYAFTISAKKDGTQAKDVAFATNVALGVINTTISDIEIPFPQEINGEPKECERKPDLNNDSKVDLIDFSILLSQWRTFDCLADLDKSGRVDLKDLGILLKAWTK